MIDVQIDDNSLILAAEDFNKNEFRENHFFTEQDQKCISKLRAHGPVLLKGSRGCGKSALMIEASLGLYPHDEESSTLGIYVSLRNLELLRSSGNDYVRLLCILVQKEVEKSLPDFKYDNSLDSVSELQDYLNLLSKEYNKRIVLLFDDAAHIGREKSLGDFFDIFRTVSNNVISCKASIYPGVTNFGIRFDVYNDATVIEVNRSETDSDFPKLFDEVINLRFSQTIARMNFSSSMSKMDFCKLTGMAVLGNMRSFIYCCDQLLKTANGSNSLTLSHISEAFKQLSNNYFWPLLEEIEPKLGIYIPMVSPAKDIAEILFNNAGNKSERSIIILREICQKYSKPLEILEYVGFISRKEVSRVMKSRGRGTRYVLNLCNIADYLAQGRINSDMSIKWTTFMDESIEYHRGSEIYSVPLPEISTDLDLQILSMDIDQIKKSQAYPYGLTEFMIESLRSANFTTVESLINANESDLLKIERFGDKTVKRVMSTVNQAVWM